MCEPDSTHELVDLTPESEARGPGGRGSRRTMRQLRGKAATLIAQQILGDITANQMKAGQGLPPEHKMLEEYEVGRGTLREALRFLELQGILQIKAGPGGGPIVAVPDSRHLANALGLLLQMSETKFSAIIEARRMLEPQLAALAAERADTSLVVSLESSIAVMKSGIGDHRVFLQENRHFHGSIAWAGGNPVFAYLMEALQWMIDGSPQGVQYPERYRRVVMHAHERIAEAITKRNSREASDRMYEHIQEFYIYLQKHYPRACNQSIVWELVGI